VASHERDRLRIMLHRRKGLPDDWLEIVEEHVAVWSLLDDRERELLEGTSDWLLRHKHWEAANGFALVDEITVTIAAQAALLVLGLSVDEYREVSAIIVYPTAMQSRGVYAGPVSGTVIDGVVPVLGEAHDRRGPVLLAWDQAQDAARNPGRGHNVVLHEFAHKLDMRDSIVDGTPRLEHREDLTRWVEVCAEAYDALRAGLERPPLQPYGATNPAEFFAVATEAFFDVPVALERHEPDLYSVMRDFYKQDPAERARRMKRRS
jgi:Mlc titration factor MtfA (ptsG expression regulator)